MKRSLQKKAQCLRRQPEFSKLDKSRSFFLVGLTFLVILFMGASIFYISTHIQVVGIGYQINQALAEKQKLIEENKRLDLEIARLKSPTRLEKEGKEKFNLVIPSPEQIIYLSKFDQASLLHRLAQNTSSPRTKENENKEPSSATSAKTSSQNKKKLIVAKIIRPVPRAQTQKSQKKRKERVPAIMIDPLP